MKPFLNETEAIIENGIQIINDILFKWKKWSRYFDEK